MICDAFVCVCVCAFVRACARACVCACVCDTSGFGVESRMHNASASNPYYHLKQGRSQMALSGDKNMHT